MDSIFTWIFSLGFVVLGLAGVCVGLWSLRKTGRSKHWPTTSGMILRSELVESEIDGGVEFHAEIVYEYEVQDRRCLSSQVVLGDGSAGWREVAERRVARYPVGAVVPVYFNPADVSKSILQRGHKPGIKVLVYAGMTMVVFGTVLAFLMPKLVRQFNERRDANMAMTVGQAAADSWKPLEAPLAELRKAEPDKNILIIFTARWDASSAVLKGYLRSASVRELLAAPHLSVYLADCTEANGPGSAEMQRHGTKAIPFAAGLQKPDGSMAFTPLNLQSEAALKSDLEELIKKGEAPGR